MPKVMNTLANTAARHITTQCFKIIFSADILLSYKKYGPQMLTLIHEFQSDANKYAIIIHALSNMEKVCFLNSKHCEFDYISMLL